MEIEKEETRRAVFDWRISMGNVLVVVGMVVGGFWYFADIDKTNALQNAQIAANRAAFVEQMDAEKKAHKEAIAAEAAARKDAIAAATVAQKEAIAAESTARREALQDLRIPMDADRAEMRQQFTEMRQQFSKLNDKMDALLKQQGEK